ncbi:copper amine oxidase N-terminal domain-containing protein [Paenibacillus lycopersici]|uniref:Copper amine oxidase N-terminal domain-containing protein n=1 Tax=Paenibacillus lycopersici TaxID=2704462 RepID=A0A6C0G0S1_9BACL|nr:copper amine oxidase N-terminal domain-containing protein [Paenibacillus lycopersici]QHT63038.1 copper amine oxidase N-terminal domain-containing protein [Paenibacillus lycopersici]
MKMKRLFGLALSVMLAMAVFAGTASAAASSSAASTIKVKLNGEWVIFPSPPVLLNGKTFVEFRTLFTKLGYSIDYNAATKTIKAKSSARSIQMTPTGTSALVDGAKVPVNGEMKLLDGRTMVGVRFIATLSDKNVDWDGTKKIVTITDKGPTAAQQAEVFAVLKALAAAEDKQDAAAYLALFHAQSPLKQDLARVVPQQFASIHTQTTYEDMEMDTYSATEAVVYTLEQSKKIGGTGFFANVENEVYYTLRKDTNGKWAIYDVEVDSSDVLDEDSMWAQEVTAADADKTAMNDVLNAQIAAINAADVTAYGATLDSSDSDAYDDDLASWKEIFDDKTLSFKAQVVRSAVVELHEDSAVLLVNLRYDLNSTEEEDSLAYKSVTLFDLVKKDGKWLVVPGSSDHELIGEEIE